MSAIGNEGAAVGTGVNSADRLSVPRRAIRENPKSTKERSVRDGPVHVSVAIAEALERISK